MSEVSIEVAARVDDAPLIAERRWQLFAVAERLEILGMIDCTVIDHGEQSPMSAELEGQIRATLCVACHGTGEGDTVVDPANPANEASLVCPVCGGSGNRPEGE